MLLKGFKSRIQMENAIMILKMPQFKHYHRGGLSSFMGWQKTSAGNHQYQLKLSLPAWYPDETPSLYVISPQTLWKYGGATVNSVGTSHAFHTLENGPGGCVQICHFNPENWDASKTCVGVFIKGILWLEAYEMHLVSGMNIAEILKQWKRR